MCLLQQVEALHFHLCLCTPWCCKILKPLRVDITSAKLLTGPISYFISDIYELMQKMEVPGIQGMPCSTHQQHRWEKEEFNCGK